MSVGGVCVYIHLQYNFYVNTYLCVQIRNNCLIDAQAHIYTNAHVHDRYASIYSLANNMQLYRPCMKACWCLDVCTLADINSDSYKSKWKKKIWNKEAIGAKKI